MFVCNLLPLLIYAIRKTGRRFSVFVFAKQNVNRLTAGAVAVVLLTVLLIVLDVTELAAILSPLSITIRPDGTKTGIAGAIGLSVGALQIIALSSKSKK